jgi:hypothetical protein
MTVLGLYTLVSLGIGFGIAGRHEEDRRKKSEPPSGGPGFFLGGLLLAIVWPILFGVAIYEVLELVEKKS